MKDSVVIKTLNEAIDALGDIPAEICTDQQQQAYNLCLEKRDELKSEMRG